MHTFKRGFFCSDLSIRYPYKDCTITVPMLLLMMLLLPMLFVAVVEIMRICKRFRTRLYFRNLWRAEATFSFGFIATYLTTELAKHAVGRLRPHFFHGCQPRLDDGSSCSDPQNAELYVEQFHCSNHNLSTRQIRELHVSFPSAHSSLSFYSMVLLALYVHGVWRSRGGVRALRHVLQFLLLMAALCVSLSRVADYWHHWSDVLAGALLGVTYAAITAAYVGDLLRRRTRSTGRIPPSLNYSHHLHHQLMADNNNSTASAKVHFLAAAASPSMTTTTPLDDIQDSDVEDCRDSRNSRDSEDSHDSQDSHAEDEDDNEEVYKPQMSRPATPPTDLTHVV
ncbi:putative phosphatidate phosphatase [Drosophila sechellia]|uniref:GM22093 n=1 Tax=Drosophila sechellia TaxID=7238 RepID=B4IB05_DROSE|nr:putative phosphatidate phosphatase [Drosophila sechellia]EDW44468.1 GM22093 [Drosophila sechellia]